MRNAILIISLFLYGNSAFAQQYVPLEIINENGKDIYEKFGISFMTACYGGSAAIEIKDNKVYFSEYQHNFDSTKQKDVCVFNIIKKTAAQNTLVFTCSNLSQDSSFITLTFTKNENPGLISVTVEGPISCGLKVHMYYTPRDNLSKFKIADCGDFDG